ncbi:MAG: sugar kinase [Flavobacteriaceae bacterium]
MSFTTFGEIMLRLVPAGQEDNIQTANLMAVNYAGSESNVATSLACLGNKVQFVSKLPLNALGKAAIQSLNKHGVSTHSVQLGGDRIGTYFIQLGASIRPSRVIYDRAGSAIADIGLGEFDWEHILKNQKWLHLSGITPALSTACAKETILAAKTARTMGVKVSFDLNYRRSLWPNADKARKSFDQIIEYTDLLFGNVGVLKDVYRFEIQEKKGVEQTVNTLQKVRELFGVEQVAFTVRKHNSATHNEISGASISDKEPVFSPSYSIQITDRFGTGDAFAAGFLHALGKGWDAKKTIDFATAAFALKHTMMGDIHISNEQEINSIAEGNTSGHVIR